MLYLKLDCWFCIFVSNSACMAVLHILFVKILNNFFSVRPFSFSLRCLFLL